MLSLDTGLGKTDVGVATVLEHCNEVISWGVRNGFDLPKDIAELMAPADLAAFVAKVTDPEVGEANNQERLEECPDPGVLIVVPNVDILEQVHIPRTSDFSVASLTLTPVAKGFLCPSHQFPHSTPHPLVENQRVPR